MSGYSTIEWTDATWNPVTGCTKVSAGCAHCYAERLATEQPGFRPTRSDAIRILLHKALDIEEGK
jgi:protein gp37